jgi:phospho-N-acetylmuramoyl-pentapeptide-transferase
MLYYFLLKFQHYLSILHAFQYVSVRAIAALFTAFFFCLWAGGFFIKRFKHIVRSNARISTPQAHKAKDGLPTMGGIFIIAVVALAVLLWADIFCAKVWIFLLSMGGFGIIGFCDDWCKVRYKEGIRAITKFLLQVSLAACIGVCLLVWGGVEPVIVFPFFKGVQPYLGYFFILWVMLVMVATSNAVNLTDGLDGLAIGSLLPNFTVFAALCYLAGHRLIALYLFIPFANSAEGAVIAAALVGACLGFLWYNAHPAEIFMGDVGSLALGAALAYLALISKQELLLLIAGGIFVLETLSVMFQVYWYRFFKRRIFKMSPIHHHFELLGWPETKITTRFTIISCLLCVCALITLKLR